MNTELFEEMADDYDKLHELIQRCRNFHYPFNLTKDKRITAAIKERREMLDTVINLAKHQQPKGVK